MVLGLGLAGLCPLVVMQIRQVRVLELQLQGQMTNLRTNQPMVMVDPRTWAVSPPPTYYIVPWSNLWARKLSGGAPILTSSTNIGDPGPMEGTLPAPYPATVVELDAPPSSQSIVAYVDVAAP